MAWFRWRRPGRWVRPGLDVGLQWVPAAAAVVAVLAVGGVGTGAAILTERGRAEQRDRQAATVAAAAISDRLARSTTALAGVNGLATDGTVTDEEFATFAGAVLANSSLPSLARSVIVPDADRAGYEQRTGRPIIERNDAGAFVAAARRAMYVPVTDVLPRTDVTRRTLGFDVISDPVRAAAAAEASRTGRLVLSAPVRLAPSGRPGFFVIQPIFTPAGGGASVLIGYLSTGIPSDDMLAAAQERLRPGLTIGLRDGDHQVAGASTGGSTASIAAAGRNWVVRVHDPAGVDPVLPIVVTGATLLLAGLLTALAWRGVRFEQARAAMAQRLAAESARNQRLAGVARRLSAAENLEEVVAIIAQDVPGVVGADIADIGLILDGENLSMLGAVRGDAGVDPDILDRYRRVPLHLHLPTTDAVRDRRVVLVEDLVAYQQDEPAMRADVVASGLASAAATPLLDPAGGAVGVLSLAWRRPVQFDSADGSVIRTVGDLCGQTLERARVADRRHAFIAALQRRLLPVPPVLPDLPIAALYQPAAAAVGMGGDWYQFLPQEDGSLVVVIGDVVGHGVEAIAAMTQIQHVIAAAVHTGVPLAGIFAHVHTALEGDSTHATAEVLHVDLARQRVGYVSAGHPYALLRRPDGSTVVLNGSQHPMIGLPPTDAELAYVDFPAGSMLLVYTDGLVERRTRPITEGIEALRVELAGLRQDNLPQALDELVRTLLGTAPEGGAVDDNVAVVLIHHS